LDCLTPEGQKWIARQSTIAQIIAKVTGASARETLADPSNTIDVRFYVGGDLKAIAEIKCREMDVDELRRYGSYLITHDKLVRAYGVSRDLKVPMYLFVGLRRDRRIVYWKLTDCTGAPIIDIERRITDTKRTCNDAQRIKRINAYIPLDNMHELKYSGDMTW